MKPFSAPFLGALSIVLFLLPPAPAGVVISSMVRVAEARASATDVSELNTDTDTVFDETAVGEFNAAPTAAASGDVPIAGGQLATNAADAGLNAGITFAQTSGGVVVSGSFSGSAGASQAPVESPSGIARAEAQALLLLNVEVAGQSETLSFEADAALSITRGGPQGFGATDVSFRVLRDGELFREASLLCVDEVGNEGGAACPSAIPPLTLLLEPGGYAIEVGVSFSASGGAPTEVSHTSTWTLGITGESGCVREWAAPVSGAFSDDDNWSPATAPRDTGDGCDDALLNLPGTFEITYAAAAADSLSVLQGGPVLRGGSLALRGEDGNAVAVSGAASLTVDSGSVEADSALISGSDASLNLRPGASMTVTTALETGREGGESGAIALAGGGAEATLSVVGNATLGGSGNSLLLAEGPATLDVLGDFSMAVFDGSESGMVLGEAGAASPPAVALTVAEEFIIGGAGEATATLDAGVVASAGSVSLGKLAGGLGTLNILSGAAMTVTEGTDVGGEGVGALNISSGGRFTSEDLAVDSSDENAVSTLSLAGLVAEEDAELEVGFTLIVGNKADGQLEMLGNSRVTAEFAVLGALQDSFGLATAVGDADLSPGNGKSSTVRAKQFLLVGQRGSGRFNTRGVSDHTYGALLLGGGASGSGTYSAEGALNSTSVESDLIVGQQGTGDFVARGAGVFAGACVLGAEPGAFGVLRLFEGGSLLLNVKDTDAGDGSPPPSISSPGFLQVGREANGLVELFDATTRLACDEAIIGGDNAAAGGTLNVDTGAAVECLGSLALGAGAGPGLVRVADGAAMGAATALIIGPKGLLIAGGGAAVTSGSVVVTGRLRVENSLSIERPFVKDAQPAPAAANQKAGPAVLNGNLNLAAGGVLEVEAGAGTALLVTGDASLLGALVITLPPGIPLEAGQLLDLVAFQGAVSRTFTSVTFINAPDGFEGGVEFEGGALRLRVISGGAGSPEGEGEGDGTDPPPGGCQGCQGCNGDAKALPWTDRLGSWLITLLSAALLGTLSLRRTA